MQPFFLYILRCGDGSYYIGHTDNLDRRMLDHADGLASAYTRERKPLTLVYSQEFPTRLEALERERQLKNWSRAKKEALIRGQWERLQSLSRGVVADPSTSSG